MTDALLDAVRQRLAQSGAAPTPAGVAAALRAQGRLLGDAEVLGAAEELRGELVGTGVLEPLLADPRSRTCWCQRRTGCGWTGEAGSNSPG